jgi:uncharacterized protein YqjF (DUF2071 family)
MTSHDFNDCILDEVGHRPWPMPRRPWIMTQTWHQLLFAHWPVDPAIVRLLVPSPLDLDLFDTRAWIGIGPFRMTNVAPRGVPALPWLSAFPELNVRTYVRAGERGGVYFFSLDASNALAVLGARVGFALPYFVASMRVRAEGAQIVYESRRRLSSTRADLAVVYGATGPAAAPIPGTLEHFLTERYCLFTVDRRGRVNTVDIHHPPWPLQPAAAEFRVNTMADAVGLRLPPVPPLLHYAERQDMVGWAPLRM